MSNQNFVMLRGVNLTRDAETINAGNKPLVKFGVAVNNGYKDSNTGEWVKTDPDFIDVESWNIKGDLFPLLVKGARVVIVGEIKYQAWEDKSGGKRSKVYVRAQSVDVIQRTDSGQQYAQQQRPQYQPTQPQYIQPRQPEYEPPQDYTRMDYPLPQLMSSATDGSDIPF